MVDYPGYNGITNNPIFVDQEGTATFSGTIITSWPAVFTITSGQIVWEEDDGYCD
jgi:hypothetical protein